ncbi:catalase family peroxidase [Acinetobacter seifertii]|nr:catalase family peroxidase [Acinetobacter seifertii]
MKKLCLFLIAFIQMLHSQHVLAGENIMKNSSQINEPITSQLIDKLYEGNQKEITGYRVNHAKGIVLTGLFTPSKQASSISTAPHFSQSVPVIVRLSNSTGIPNIEDHNPKASPRGIAIRFTLPNNQHTDIVGHSVEGFPADTPEEFLNFLSVANQAESDPDKFSNYINAHEASKHFFSLLGQTPKSFATTAFYPLHTFKFINQHQQVTLGRYQVQPILGVQYLSDKDAGLKDKNFLQTDLVEQLTKTAIQYHLVLQVSKPEDDVMRISQPWLGPHEIIDLGTITLNKVGDDQLRLNQDLAFDPTTLITGIESVQDPMFVIRSPSYRLSTIRRSQELNLRHHK